MHITSSNTQTKPTMQTKRKTLALAVGLGTRTTLTAAAILAAVLLGRLVSGRLGVTLAQDQTKVDKPANEGTPSVLPRPDFHFPGNVGRTYLDSDQAQFPQPVQAPKGAPNIVLILLDDAGFGQFSTFGGGVPSPTMDKLAAEGLRFNRFHTTALCNPTRAALITGRSTTSPAPGRTPWTRRSNGPSRWRRTSAARVTR